MNYLECILEVQKRADKLRKRKTAINNEHDAYLHAIQDVMNKRRKKMHPDDADRLEAFLLRNFWID